MLSVQDNSAKTRTSELFVRLAASGDEVECQRLRDEIVLLNLGLADSIAKRYASRGIPLDDLTQVARMALVRVVRTFKPEFERDLLAYAVPSINGELRKHFRDTGWMIRPPRGLQEAQAHVQAALPTLVQVSGRTPTTTELAEATELDETVVREAQSLHACYSPVSLDAPAHSSASDSDPLLSTLTAESSESGEDFARAEARLVLKPLVAALPRRDREVLELRFIHDLTQREVGERIGVTQMQVSRILTRVLCQLREQLEGTEPVRRAS